MKNVSDYKNILNISLNAQQVMEKQSFRLERYNVYIAFLY